MDYVLYLVITLAASLVSMSTYVQVYKVGTCMYMSIIFMVAILCTAVISTRYSTEAL
jgi:amino acid permease